MEGIDPNSSCPRDQKKAARPREQLNCPRCSSTNTKFCYYNNYSLTQPRYFCKTCRRYWTEGGSLRNVPVGGGSRKNKKLITTTSASASSSATTTTTSSSKVPDLNPKTQGGGHDLNLAFPAMDKYHDISQYVEMPNGTVPTSSLSALELLRSGMASRGLRPYAPNSMMQNSNSLYNPSGFPMQEVKPSLGFSIDGVGNRSSSYHDHHEVQENNGGRLLFPFGDHVKQLSHAGADQVEDNNKEQGNSSSTGYWTGMLGEGSW